MDEALRLLARKISTPHQDRATKVAIRHHRMLVRLRVPRRERLRRLVPADRSPEEACILSLAARLRSRGPRRIH
jgi:hypothetical protein